MDDCRNADEQELRLFPFQLVRMHISLLNAATYYPPHDRQEYQLYCLLSGKVDYTFGDGKVFHLHEREAVIVPPGLTRSPRSRCSEGSALVALFRPRTADFHRDLTRIPLNDAQFYCADSLYKAERDRKESFPLRILRLNALLLELLGAQPLMRLCGTWGRESRGDRDALLKKVEQAEELMRSNLEHPLPLESIVKHVGLSRSALERNFRKLRGYSVMAQYRNIRLCTAKLMLQQGCSVSEAAFGTGFLTTQHFATAFRRLFKIVPSDI